MKETPQLPNRFCIDFDQTLCDSHWNGQSWIMGHSVRGMVEAVNNCAVTNEIVIFTSRPLGEWDEMREWLKVHHVKYNQIQSKPLARGYVDDRALRPGEFKTLFREAEDSGEYFSNGTPIEQPTKNDPRQGLDNP